METFSPACPVHALENADIKLIDCWLQGLPTLFLREGPAEGLREYKQSGLRHRAFSWAFSARESCANLFWNQSSRCTGVKFLGEQEETKSPFKSWGQMDCRDVAHAVVAYLVDREREWRQIGAWFKVCLLRSVSVNQKPWSSVKETDVFYVFL